ncbi:MAG: hypothetical protein PUB21_11130 [Bacteroidales bacterium]|nr:hypothetical protein [Bacteroidales bacterium]
MKRILFILVFTLIFFSGRADKTYPPDYYEGNDLKLFLEMPSVVSRNDTVQADVLFYNGSGKKVTVEEQYRDDILYREGSHASFNFIITKGKERYIFPIILKHYEIKFKNIRPESGHRFHLRVMFDSIMFDGITKDWSCIVPSPGEYELQLEMGLIEPWVRIKSNIVKIELKE